MPERPNARNGVTSIRDPIAGALPRGASPPSDSSPGTNTKPAPDRSVDLREASASVRVGVVDEHEIFALGLQVCLGRDPRIRAVTPPVGGRVQNLDVAVVSPQAAAALRFRCPVVVCGGGLPLGVQSTTGNVVSAVLPRAGLDPRQLLVVVHAVAMGLQVSPALLGESPSRRPDGRTLDVLRLLADGVATREIAARLGYAERTIKGVISSAERSFAARSRTQAVVHAMRQGWI